MEAMVCRTYRWWDSSRGFGARHKSLTAFSLLSFYHVVCAGLFVQSGLVQLGCKGSGQFVSHVSRSSRIQSVVVRLGRAFESHCQRDGDVRRDQMHESVRPRSCGRQLFCFGTSLLSLLSLRWLPFVVTVKVKEASPHRHLR
jgi:hypothetical protein